MTAAVAVMHSMLAGAMYASQKPSMKVSAIVFPVTAVGGIAEGILYAYMPSWQEADILAELFGFQLIGGTLFTVSAFWLAASAISAANCSRFSFGVFPAFGRL